MSLRVYLCLTQSYTGWNSFDGKPSRIRHGSPQELIHIMVLYIELLLYHVAKASCIVEIVGRSRLCGGEDEEKGIATERQGKGMKTRVLYVLVVPHKGLYRLFLMVRDKMVKAH